MILYIEFISLRGGSQHFFFQNIISKTIFDLKPPVAGGTFEVVSRPLGHVGPTGPMGPQNSKFQK